MLFSPFMFGLGKKDLSGGNGGIKLGGTGLYGGGGTYAPTISSILTKHEPYETYAPQVQFAPVTTYGYQGATTIISSPEAQVKKEQIMDVVSAPEMRGTWDIPTTIAPTTEGMKKAGGGISTGVIAVVAVAAVAIFVLPKVLK